MLRSMFAAAILSVCALAWGDDKDFHDQDLTGRSFAGQSLNRANFSGATLTNCNFTLASAKKANFKGAVLTNWTAYQMDASEADFTGATSAGLSIRFSDNNVTKANLEGLTLSFDMKCTLKDANLKKSKIISIFYQCDLAGADLRGANLRGAFSAGGPNKPRFTGALYDDDTAFPEGFDPKAARMILKEADKADDKKDNKK